MKYAIAQTHIRTGVIYILQVYFNTMSSAEAHEAAIRLRRYDKGACTYEVVPEL